MAAGPQSTEEGEPLSEVNVIPLADLSLVLLIILMVLSPMIMQSMIKVQNSRASAIKSLREQPKEPPIPEKHGKILDDKLISFLLMATPLPSANAMATAHQLPLTF